jgi:hypothetical protein
LKSDEPVCAGAEIKIGRDGSLAIAADTAVVVALPNSNFKCASQGGMPGKLIDVQAGSIGIRTLLGNADPIEVKSRFLDAKAKGAAFVVSADTKTSISIVKSGDVTVRDLARQKDIEATAGQLLKFGPRTASDPMPKAGNNPIVA